MLFLIVISVCLLLKTLNSFQQVYAKRSKMSSDYLNELVEMLMSPKEEVRNGSFDILSQLSGTVEGRTMIGQCKSIVSLLVAEATCGSNAPSITAALSALTNVSIHPKGAKALCKHHELLFPFLVKSILDPVCQIADSCCGLLVNLTRDSESARLFLFSFSEDEMALLLQTATTVGYNKANHKLDTLLSVFQNISQLEEGRKIFLDKKKVMLQRLYSFTALTAPVCRRRAAVAVMRNCCFEKGTHLWLLSEEVDIASTLCLPLAGPETLTDEENDSLRPLLPYQPPEKKREPDADVRLLLLEALTQLCATLSSREELRRQAIYFILREYHKWEQNVACLTLLEDLINILIRKEDEIEADDISALHIPEKYSELFEAEHYSKKCEKIIDPLCSKNEDEHVTGQEDT